MNNKYMTQKGSLKVNTEVSDCNGATRDGSGETVSVDCNASYGLDDKGFESRQGLGIFSSPSRPDWICGPPILLSTGYQVLFPWG
jgi:hypothetical protein